jgi:hypothetical protein
MRTCCAFKHVHGWCGICDLCEPWNHVGGGVPEVQEGTWASMFPSCLCDHLLVIVLGSVPFYRQALG